MSAMRPSSPSFESPTQRLRCTLPSIFFGFKRSEWSIDFTMMLHVILSWGFVQHFWRLTRTRYVFLEQIRCVGHNMRIGGVKVEIKMATHSRSRPNLTVQDVYLFSPTRIALATYGLRDDPTRMKPESQYSWNVFIKIDIIGRGRGIWREIITI